MNQKANVNVYLMLLQGDKILLSLRENTGYEDGKWSLVAGHVESNEATTDALIREAEEEIGITLDAKHITIAHVMHRKTDRENVDVFMTCSNWTNDVANKEPEKCGGLQFFDFKNMPNNMVEYIVAALGHINTSKFYSEYGWE